MSQIKLTWLKRILILKVALILLMWGLPSLFIPIGILKQIGIPTSENALLIRLLGAVITAFGVAYWYAWKDPIHNQAILKAAVVDNGLVSLVLIYFIFFLNLRSLFFIISAPLTFMFFISFIFLMPKEEQAH